MNQGMAQWGKTMKDGEVKIRICAANETLRRMVEEALREVLDSFGYSIWASGMDMETGVREIAFERTKEEIGRVEQDG